MRISCQLIDASETQAQRKDASLSLGVRRATCERGSASGRAVRAWRLAPPGGAAPPLPGMPQTALRSQRGPRARPHTQARWRGKRTCAPPASRGPTARARGARHHAAERNAPGGRKTPEPRQKVGLAPSPAYCAGSRAADYCCSSSPSPVMRDGAGGGCACVGCDERGEPVRLRRAHAAPERPLDPQRCTRRRGARRKAAAPLRVGQSQDAAGTRAVHLRPNASQA